MQLMQMNEVPMHSQNMYYMWRKTVRVRSLS